MMTDPLKPTQPEGIAAKLRRLASLIPGYGGYMDREARRDADKLLRMRVAERLGDALTQLQHLGERLSRDLKLDSLGAVDRAVAQVRTIQSQVEHADYGFSGIFDLVAIGAPQLEALYEHDTALVALADAVVAQAHKTAGASDEQTIAAELAALETVIQDFQSHVSARERVLADTGR